MLRYRDITGFMFKNENGDKVRGLVAQYFTDVIRTGHQNEFVAKENINNKNKNTGFLTTKKSIYNGSIKRYMKYKYHNQSFQTLIPFEIQVQPLFYHLNRICTECHLIYVGHKHMDQKIS